MNDESLHQGESPTESTSHISVMPKENVRDAIKNSLAYKRLVHTEAKLLISLGFWVLPVARLEKGYPELEFNSNSASNNTKTINDWFHPDTGKFAGFNLGIACGRKDGSGVVVVDADRHGRGDGVEEWIRMVDANTNPEEHPAAQTPNNGEHHFFQWHPSFTKKSTKGNQGLEVLGGKDGSFTAFALVYPSVVKNRDGELRQYNWVVHPKDCAAPDVPEWLPQALRLDENLDSGRGNENVAESDLEPTIPTEQISRMLDAIPPDELEYDEWLRLGMAINTQHPNTEGLQAWDQWSARGRRYQEDECSERWSGFSSNGKGSLVTIGTLFFYARKYGWNPKDNDKYCDQLSTKIAELNRTYAHVVVGGHARVLRLRPDHKIGELHFDLLLPSAFNSMFPGKFVDHPNWNKPKPLPKAWLESPFRRSYEFGLRLSPHKDTPDGVFNTWNGFAYDATEGDCSLFKAHLRDVICRGDLDLYSWVMDWAADCVQDPGNLKGTAIVMRGKEGTGKGTFANTFGRLFGAHYVHLIDPSHLLGNFNAHLIDAIVVFADEVTWGGNVKSQGKLKGLVTEQQLTGERKGIDAVQYRNFAHVIIASNAEWVVPAGGSSRRWLVLDIDDGRANDRAYFDAIHKELENGGNEALLYELQQRQITNNLRWAPETEALKEQRRLSAQSRDKFFEFIDQRLSEGFWGTEIVQHPDHGMCMDKKQVHTEYRQFVKDCGGSPLSAVSFWKTWLKVFPYAKGGQKEWPRTRGFGGGLTRLVVLRRRSEMCADFLDHFGTASDEVLNATEDWLEVEQGC